MQLPFHHCRCTVSPFKYTYNNSAGSCHMYLGTLEWEWRQKKKCLRKNFRW